MTDGRRPPAARNGALRQAHERALSALTFVSVLMLLAMTASVSYDVVMRYFFQRPTQWAVEFSEYMLLYMAFLPAAWVLSHESHVRIDLVARALPGQVQRWLDTVTSLVGAAACGVFCWYSASLTLETIRSGEVLFRSVIIPKWPILVVIPIGLLLLTLEFLARAWRHARGAPAEPEAALLPEL